MARDIFILLFAAVVAVLLGDGLYASYRRGVIKTIRMGRAVHRADEPLNYWFSMLASAIGFVVISVLAVLWGIIVMHELISGRPVSPH